MTVDQMRIEIDRLWDQYCHARDAIQAEASHEAWAALVAELRAATVDRTTRRFVRGL